MKTETIILCAGNAKTHWYHGKLWWRLKCLFGNHRYTIVRDDMSGKALYWQCIDCPVRLYDLDN